MLSEKSKEIELINSNFSRFQASESLSVELSNYNNSNFIRDANLSLEHYTGCTSRKIESNKNDNLLYEILYMIVTNLLFCNTSFLCKLGMTLNTSLNGFDYMFPRSLALLTCSLCEVCCFKINICDVSKQGLKLLIVRATIAAWGFPCYFISLKYLPMSKASIIVNLAPMIVPVVAYFVLKENISIIDIFSLIFGFLGCLMVNLTSLENSKNNAYEDMQLIGVALCVVALLSRVLVPITLRLLSTHIQPILAPVYFSFGVSISSIICLFIFPDSFSFENWNFASIILFFLSGISNYFEQRLMTLAYKFGKAAILTPITYKYL